MSDTGLYGIVSTLKWSIPAASSFYYLEQLNLKTPLVTGAGVELDYSSLTIRLKFPCSNKKAFLFLNGANTFGKVQLLIHVYYSYVELIFMAAFCNNVIFCQWHNLERF